MTFGKKSYVFLKKMTRILSFSYLQEPLRLMIVQKKFKILYLFLQFTFSFSFNGKIATKNFQVCICKKKQSRSIFLVGNTIMTRNMRYENKICRINMVQLWLFISFQVLACFNVCVIENTTFRDAYHHCSHAIEKYFQTKNSVFIKVTSLYLKVEKMRLYCRYITHCVRQLDR